MEWDLESNTICYSKNANVRCRMKKYKHKLNMLEPGLKMVKAIGCLAMLSLVSYFIKAVRISFLFGALAGLLAITLWILIIIEQHQDNVMNRQGIEEERGKQGDAWK